MTKTIAIDVGRKYIATVVNNFGEKPFLVNDGDMVYKMNRFNERKQRKSPKNVEKINEKQNNFIRGRFKAYAACVVRFALFHEATQIVIPTSTLWEKRNSFREIPIDFEQFTFFIKLLATKKGLHIIEVDENFTSVCDALALEKIAHHDQYKGERSKRGLFRSSTGINLHSDINGALNIMRLGIGDTCIEPFLVNKDLLMPYKVNPFDYSLFKNK